MQLGIARNHRPAHDVGVAVQELGGGVHHQVGAELERSLQHRAEKGVVHRQQHAPRAADFGDGGEIAQLEQRVGGRLHPAQPRRRAHRLGKGLGPGGIDVAHVDAELLHDPFEDPVGATVEVVGGNHVIAGREQVEHGGGGGAAGGEGDAEAAALERGQVGFERGARRVLGARILVAFVLAGPGLHVGRGQVDGRGNRAREWVGEVPGVDCQRLQVRR